MKRILQSSGIGNRDGKVKDTATVKRTEKKDKNRNKKKQTHGQQRELNFG